MAILGSGKFAPFNTPYGYRGAVRIRDLQDGRSICVLGEDEVVTAVAITPNDKHIIWANGRTINSGRPGFGIKMVSLPDLWELNRELKNLSLDKKLLLYAHFAKKNINRELPHVKKILSSLRPGFQKVFDYIPETKKE